MLDGRDSIVAWLGRDIMPHEADVRAWLSRSMRITGDVDDIIQETYCRLSSLAAVEHIINPRAYFFQSARRVVLEQMRRARVVSIESMAEIEMLSIEQDIASPERITAGRRELARVRVLIDALPERCRRIFQMRKIEGLSQREIAHRLGISENIVENEAVRGLRAILAAYAESDRPTSLVVRGAFHNDRPRKRR